MSLKILCGGHLIRYPIGGHSWHHLQYLVGLQRLGHNVTFVEHYGWENSCYDASRHAMTSDPGYGIDYLVKQLRPFGLEDRWCYLAQDGTAHGMSRERLNRICRDSDLYLNLSNINWFPELEACRRRALVDTDPVFTQIGAHGLGGPYSRYDALFTYGENVHLPGCAMPTGGARWLPTRQPVVLDLWRVEPGDPSAPFTTVTNWSPLGDRWHEGRLYGQKDRSFESFIELPRMVGAPLEIAVNPSKDIRRRLEGCGWRVVHPFPITRDPQIYQGYLRASRAELSVAKHGYVVARCGWFSDRSTGYLASGRPVVIQDTGFTEWLPTGLGVMSFTTVEEACRGIEDVAARYDAHCRAAREIVVSYFEAGRVLTDLIERAMTGSAETRRAAEPSA